MSENINCLTKVDYADKGRIESLSDFLLTPLRYALNGRTVRCLDRQTWDKATKNHHNEIEFIISRKESGFRHIIKRICAMAIAIILLPTTTVGLIGKGCSRSKELAGRFAERRNSDKYGYEYRSTKGLLRSIVAAFAHVLQSCSSLSRGAHILADQEMGKDQPFSSEKGGHNPTSAKVLREELEKYRTLHTFGSEENKALKIAREHEQWAYCMLGVMSSNDHDTALDLQDRLNSLDLRETFLVPMSIGPKTGRHTITVGFNKNSDSSFSLTVFNCGAGISHNHPLLNGKVFPFQIHNISLEHITNLEFLKGFVQYGAVKRTASYNDFYNFLTDQQWNEGAEVNYIQSWLDQLSDHHARTPQRSGSCTWRSPLTAFKFFIPHGNYKQFIYAMKVNETERMAKTAKKKKKNSREHQLARIGLQKCENWERSKLGAPLPAGLKCRLDEKLAAARQLLQ